PTTESPERIGPLYVRGTNAVNSHGAECLVATTPDGREANVWRWPAAKLDGLVIPSLALLIETLQDVSMAGVARIVHGSVATDHAVIAYTRPMGQTLSDYLRRGKTSPIEAVTSALTLMDGLAAMRALGVRGAWWTPDSLWAMDDEAQWTLAAPGLVSVLRGGHDATVSDIAFRAPEAATLSTVADTSEQTYTAIEVYAIGATLYYALSQRFPFDCDTVDAYVQAQQGEEAVRLDGLFDHLAPYEHLVDVVASCLDADPSARPESLEALRRVLEDAEREVRYQHSRVDFLPARVSETFEMQRPGRTGESEDTHPGGRSSFLPLLALIALITIALFLIGR
ncbi:MAG: hypothetical protein QF464_11965, partial [Myxococcota bacterium]|nr:hypothetical protein [Myxococcota bacterium]